LIKKVEYFFKRIFLKSLLFLYPKRSGEENPTFNPDSKVLFIRLHRIGDALISTPIIRAVKEQIGCKVYVLADKANHFVFSNNPYVDEIFVFPKGIKIFYKVRRLAKNIGIDTVVDLHSEISTTVSFLVALIKAKNKFGLKRGNDEIFTKVIPKLEPGNNHVLEAVSEISALFNITMDFKKVTPDYFPNVDALRFADDFFSKYNSDSKFLLGINISAGSNSRFWGINNFKLLLSLLESYNIIYLLFCNTKDFGKAKQICEEKYIYPVSNDFSIFAAGIMRLDMVFTPDTSTVHIASAKRIPVFGLYVKDKETHMIWSPYGTDFECVTTGESNIHNISFDEVRSKFIPFLEKHSAG